MPLQIRSTELALGSLNSRPYCPSFRQEMRYSHDFGNEMRLSPVYRV